MTETPALKWIFSTDFRLIPDSLFDRIGVDKPGKDSIRTIVGPAILYGLNPDSGLIQDAVLITIDLVETVLIVDNMFKADLTTDEFKERTREVLKDRKLTSAYLLAREPLDIGE